MDKENLSVRAITRSDIQPIIDYWHQDLPEYWLGMGADMKKMPSKENFRQILAEQIATPIEEKSAFASIWLLNNQPIGHCNVNQIVFGKHAHMHLHLWNRNNRQQGLGSKLVIQSVRFFFEQLQLEKLYCEPYAHNPAPNKTLEKVGFKFIQTYRTIPGTINFEQDVNKWVIDKVDLKHF